MPAALLIAGSGPTDATATQRPRPENERLFNLAGVLAADGVASLRYDKLGSGKTGLGAAAKDLDKIGLDVFTDEATAALGFLAARPGVDPDRLTVFGHSKGAPFTLLPAPPTASAKSVHTIGLLEPLSKQYLDIITDQVTAQIDQQKAAGLIDDALAKKVTTALAVPIEQLRADGTVPGDLLGGLDTLFARSSQKFLQQDDRIDPAKVAAQLLKDMHLTGVDHVLKEDGSKSPVNYGKDLPFSAQLVEAFGEFVSR